MRISVLVLIFAIPLCAFQANPARGKNSDGDNGAKPTNQAADGLNSSSTTAINETVNAGPREDPEKTIKSDGTGDPPPWPDRLNASSTTIIAVFTALLFIGVIVQICTSRTIERAWVMAEIQPDSEKPNSGRLQVFEGSGTDGDSTAAMNAVLICSNAGKTPAWIEETIAKFDMVKSLPKTPNFESAQSIQRFIIPLGMAEGGTIPYSQKIQWTPIAKGHQHTDEMAVIYGRVIYRDIFGRKRVTRFGYKISPHGRLERLEGHPEYNKAT